MKRYLFGFAICVASTASNAQGYVGAVRSFTNIGYDCPQGMTCDKSGHGWRFYGGTKLSASSQIDLGIGKIDSIEVGYLKYAQVVSGGQTTIDYLNSVGEPDTRVVPTALRIQADALTLAMVARFPLIDQLSASARLGVAYVSSTVRRDLDGMTNTSETTTKLKPYVGLGVEYDIPSIVKLIGTFDLTKIDAGGFSGNARMIGLGAERSF